MTDRTAFCHVVEDRLQTMGTEFDQFELLDWLDAMPPPVNEDPDVERWALAFAAIVRERREAAMAP